MANATARSSGTYHPSTDEMHHGLRHSYAKDAPHEGRGYTAHEYAPTHGMSRGALAAMFAKQGGGGDSAHQGGGGAHAPAGGAPHVSGAKGASAAKGAHGPGEKGAKGHSPMKTLATAQKTISGIAGQLKEAAHKGMETAVAGAGQHVVVQHLKKGHKMAGDDHAAFESQAQRRFMYAKHPKLAKEFESKTPKRAKLPERAK